MLAQVWRSLGRESPAGLQAFRTNDLFSAARPSFLRASFSSSSSCPLGWVISFSPPLSLCAGTLWAKATRSARATCAAWLLVLASLRSAFLLCASPISLWPSASASDSPIRLGGRLMLCLHWFARERVSQRRRQRRKRAQENAELALAFALRPPAPLGPALPSAWRRAPVPDAGWRSTCLQVKGRGR